MAQDDVATPQLEPRLIISNIVCENFKSYAGVKELGPFHKCFSAIVGPNGSGKSNVIDAMLFVFGYRAKKIRSKSVSVLMHNSEHHQNITSCTVTVHFQKIIDQDGTVEFTVVPGSQFRVSRTAFKDNSSYYQLNGRKVPFKEISCLLKQAGIDLDHNRFLILQGEVEQIALMKPKALTEHDEGMLEFLEDIIGTSQYKEPIDELGVKVEELHERRGEKLNRVKVMENEKDRLEGAKNEAEEFLRLKHSLSVKQYQLYEHYKHECKQLETQALEKKSEVETKIKEVNDGFKESKQKMDDMTAQRKKLLKKRDKFSQIVETSKNTLKSCEQEDVRVRQEIKNNKNQLKKVTKNLEKEKEKLVEYENAPDKCQKLIEDGNAKIKVLEARKSQEEQLLSEIMSSLKGDTQSIQDEKEEYENNLVGLCQKVNEMKSKFEVANSDLELYKERCTASERQLTEDKGKLDKIKASVTSKDNELRTCESSLIEMDSEISSCKESLKVAQDLRQSLPQLMKIARNQIFEAQSQRSRSQIMDELMKQKYSGNILGICGRLGDLGTIPDKYDVAVSTACPGLDYCVVDTMETAVKCVEFLKRADLGTATFIAIDKMERHRSSTKGKASASQNIPRLFDLITPKDSKYLTCFYHVMGEMLVADNLDQATKIGLQGKTRHNVVTLQGQLISQAGAMTGGGSKVIKGKMSSKLQSEYTPEQLNLLRANLESQEASYEKSLNDCSEIESKLNTLQKKYSGCRKRMGELEKEIQILTEQEKGTEERIKQAHKQGNKMKVDPKHLAKLEKEVEKFQKEYDTATVAADEVKSIVRGLTEEIMRIGGNRISEQQKLIDKIKKELEECSTSVTKASVAIKSAERNAKKSIAKTESLEGDISVIESKLEGLHRNIKELEQRALEAIDKEKSAENGLGELNAELSVVQQGLQELENKQKETNELLLDLKHEMEAYTAKVKENQGKIKHFNNEIAKLSLDEESPELQDQQINTIDKQQAEYEITMLDEKLKQMSPNLAAIDEYKKKEDLLESRKKELDLVTLERDNAHDAYNKLRLKRHNEFMTGFTIITDKLKQMYQMITLGGDAELELMDSLDPFAEGIVFSVRPPKKSWKNISNLSGGEKTLSSLALVFALHHYKPSPLYVMDEIDAALDFKNVSIVAHYIKERTKNAQFIIISLRNNMFELADRLVGIYKTHNCTKTVTADPKKIEDAINLINNH